MKKEGKERKWKLLFCFISTRPVIENSKKNSKNKKPPLRLLFRPNQVRKGREWEKIKIIVLISSSSTRNREFRKNCKKIQKIENRLGKAKKERKEKLLFRSIATRPVIENSKKRAKKFKKLWNTIRASFQAKTGRQSLRKRVNKNYQFDQFLPDP